ncbi:MAG: hypothetical protein B6U87_03125 [Candidatus Aenigmarchaeota archaeon ex4484_52]|nr:MAG: hypothetical protein B6U87_03125 [Candidatus Aenigmarchaeota archaeon ex4484_52]
MLKREFTPTEQVINEFDPISVPTTEEFDKSYNLIKKYTNAKKWIILPLKNLKSSLKKFFNILF